MSELLPIQNVDTEAVRRVVRDSLRGGLDYDQLADFVALVDWSGVIEPLPPIAETLGALEQWTTEYSEGDITREELISRLLSMLPREERTSLARSA